MADFLLTPTVTTVEAPGDVMTRLRLPSLLKASIPSIGWSTIREALRAGVLDTSGKLAVTRGALAEDPRDGNLVATAQQEINWGPGEGDSTPRLPSALLLPQLKNIPAAFGSRAFLSGFLTGPLNGRVQFTVRVEHTYTHKGLRNAEARERRDLDAEFLVREKLANPSSFHQVLKETFEAMYVQLQLCCQYHNKQAMQRLITGLELGLCPGPGELSGGVQTKRKAYAEAEKLHLEAEAARDKAWAEYSETYKKEAVRHLVSWAPEEAKDLLQTLLNESINVNEPLRFL